MKKSEQLRQEANAEDNDLKYMGLAKKALREERLERFENYIPLLEAEKFVVIPFNGQKVTIDTQTNQHGILDFYPKANKILIRNKNQWVSQGLKWLIETFKLK